ncbi:MAG: PID-CTERM protein-sorting domain-containing protein [Microcystis sp.]
MGITVYFEVIGNNNSIVNSTNGPPPPPSLVPIDGGLSVLMLTGAALGVRQMQRKWSKKKKDEDSRSSL